MSKKADGGDDLTSSTPELRVRTSLLDLRAFCGNVSHGAVEHSSCFFVGWCGRDEMADHS